MYTSIHPVQAGLGMLPQMSALRALRKKPEPQVSAFFFGCTSLDTHLWQHA